MIRSYTLLTKPGIIAGNLATTAAGFGLASKGVFNIPLFFTMLTGLGAIIASACVINNYIDREADQKMKRTQKRAHAMRAISVPNAWIFAAFLCLAGTLILAYFTNGVALSAALAGFLVYTLFYSLSKYHTTYGTLIGSISGALPPVVGYAAVSQTLDLNAALLFLVLFLWQMPHFYAIAIYNIEDYRAASIPVLPIHTSLRTTKIHITLYIAAFILAAAALFATTFSTLIVAFLNVSWLALSLVGFRTHNNIRWAKQMFAMSLVIICTICLLLL